MQKDEKKTWEELKGSKDLKALQDFMDQCEDEGIAEKALLRIQWLKEDGQLEKVLNDESGLIRFIRTSANFPDLRKKARERLEELEDEAAWKEAQKKRTATAYFDYLERFSLTGKYKTEAQQFLDMAERDYQAAPPAKEENTDLPKPPLHTLDFELIDADEGRTTQGGDAPLEDGEPENIDGRDTDDGKWRATGASLGQTIRTDFPQKGETSAEGQNTDGGGPTGTVVDTRRTIGAEPLPDFIEKSSNKGARFRVAARTHEGKLRNHNEDNYIVCPDLDEDIWIFKNEKRYWLGEKGCLMVVADGNGGMEAGEVAAEIAITTVKKYFQQLKLFDEHKIEKVMKKVFLMAGKMMELHAKEHPATKGMGTTLTVVWLRERTAHMAWAGDSRVYLSRKGKKIKQMNKDHSLVQNWIDEGRLSDEEAFYHPKNNVITQNIGALGKLPKPEYGQFSIEAEDRILVCSDGLNGMLLDKEIEKIMEQQPENITYTAEALEKAALKAGGEDNITIVLSYIHEV